MIASRPVLFACAATIGWSLACAGDPIPSDGAGREAPDRDRAARERAERETTANEALRLLSGVSAPIGGLDGCEGLDPRPDRPLGEVVRELERDVRTREGTCEGGEIRRCVVRLQRGRDDGWVATFRFETNDEGVVPSSIGCNLRR